MTGLGLSAPTLPENREAGRTQDPRESSGPGAWAWADVAGVGPLLQEGETHGSRASPKLHSFISSKNAANSTALGLNKHPCPHGVYILVEGMTWKEGRWWWCSKTGLRNRQN